ncbi:DUF5702 domain-containing protein [Alkaliphilus hydrothermalis]|uniref:Flp pilus-assembly TadG-like N-terminal domain-containing protein n=1 Tax=Alkaliphilus hydrothermalis TaxID=1482730 RepID=A0ABS2NSD3_9FIRM|nr:hypothetical protein [Alkaliphilus hydrothermalis]
MIYFNRNKQDEKDYFGEKGTITVFLSITLLVVITLTGMLVDGARIRTGDATMKRVASTALISTLSHYDQTLKKEYGLFALAMPQGEMEAFVKEYMNKGLRPTDFLEGPVLKSKADYWDLYQFNIEKLQVTPRYSLEEDVVLRQQILEHMKYRGPKILVEEFYEKIKAMSTVEENATLLKEKIEIERELNDLAHMEKELLVEIQKAKRFNHQQYKQLGEGIGTDVVTIVALQGEKHQLLKELQHQHGLLANVPPEDKKQLEDSIAGIGAGIAALQEKISNADQQLTSQITQITSKLKGHMEANAKIQQLAGQIEEKMLAIKSKIEALEGTNVDIATMKKELDKYRKAIEEYSIGDLVEVSGANYQSLREALLLINQINSTVAYRRNENYASGEVGEINGKVKDYNIKINQYNNDLTYYKWQLEPEEEKEAREADERKKAAREANDLLSTKEKDSIVIPQKLQDILPSKGMEGKFNFSPIEFDYEPKDLGYSDESFNMISTILGGAEALGEGIRNEIYINEYILDVFNNYVNQEKKQRTAFFNSEVEYILYGNPSQQENITAVKRDLIMMRFVVNLLYVYSDPKLVESATILATSLAAPIGPAAMPLIKTLILCGYAMNYSVEDVNQLLKGEAVNFYRGKEALKLIYEDYVRFLLLRPGYSHSTKINRVKDLIQLNLQKNPIYGEKYLIKQSNTFVDLKVQYSMKVLFWGKKDRQAHYKMELMQGY